MFPRLLATALTATIAAAAVAAPAAEARGLRFGVGFGIGLGIGALSAAPSHHRAPEPSIAERRRAEMKTEEAFARREQSRKSAAAKQRAKAEAAEKLAARKAAEKTRLAAKAPTSQTAAAPRLPVVTQPVSLPKADTAAVSGTAEASRQEQSGLAVNRLATSVPVSPRAGQPTDPLRQGDSERPKSTCHKVVQAVGVVIAEPCAE